MYDYWPRLNKLAEQKRVNNAGYGIIMIIVVLFMALLLK
jgi:hypothetical protein